MGIGEMVWPTCGSSVMRRDISKNAQNTALGANSNPKPNRNPYPYQLWPEKIRRFFRGGKNWSTTLNVVS